MASVKLDPELVQALREGLLTLLAADAEQMAGALVASGWRARDTAASRARTERCWSLLDLIGWEGAPLSLDLGANEHLQAADEACAAIVPLLDGWLAEATRGDPRVAGRLRVLGGLRELAAMLAARPYR